jgi:hypothetical protein
MGMGCSAQSIVRILLQWNPEPFLEPANACTTANKTKYRIDQNGKPNAVIVLVAIFARQKAVDKRAVELTWILNVFGQAINHHTHLIRDENIQCVRGQ